MYTISLHNIRFRANVGLYPLEKLNGNDFEVDVDVSVNSGADEPVPFIDYSILHQIVTEAFQTEGELLETFAQLIHQEIRKRFAEAQKIRVAIRKMHPPLNGDVGHSQVSLEA